MAETPEQDEQVNTSHPVIPVAIQPMPEFRPEAHVGASLATRWDKWLSDFEMYILASAITDPKCKRALLLYQAGSRVREIFRSLQDTGPDEAYDTAKQRLKEYFDPQKNRRYEVYCFRQTVQQPNETLDSFHTRLRRLAETCEFNDVEFEIEQQIIIGGTSSKIRKRALRDPQFALKDMLLGGRRDEQSTYQAKDIESKDVKDAEANKIATQQGQKTEQQTCRNCGRKYPHDGRCPATGKICNKCGKPNHFANVCRSTAQKPPRKHMSKKPKPRTVRPLKQENHHSDSDSDESYLYTVNSANKNNANVKVTVNSVSFTTMVDTGASINVIDEQTFSKFREVTLKSTKTKAFAYNQSEPVNFLGKFEAVVETRKRMTVATFYVVQGQNSGNLLSLSTAQDLGLVTLHINPVSTKDAALDSIIGKHQSVFHGLGKLKGTTVKLDIDKSITPKALPQRRIPYHIRDKVKTALKELEKQDVIERVPEDQATPWVQPIVAVPKKDGNVRICVDMRLPNEAIRRIRHPIPTVNDISIELNGAKYFTKLDLSQAYHQLVLDEQSRYITTFSTHIGLFRYKRLNYGTNASAEIFQYVLQRELQGLPGVRNIADDIIVFGATRAEHDANLDGCLRRLENKGLRLNRDKCVFLSNTLEFFGQIFSKDGIRPDPKRVTDLLNAPRPGNVSEVRSLLGMANYSSQYIPDFATLTAPLRELTKKNAQFAWTTTHEQSFKKLTAALATSPCMAYFDKDKETSVVVDASPVGISAILSQNTLGQNDHKIISYASRALTDPEKKYSQTEKEALAIVWSVEHFHLFLYGAKFSLITDHKPLEVIYGKRTAKASARIERWILRLQPYTFNIVYKSGAENPVDYLSRHPTAKSVRTQERMTEEYINFVVDSSIPKAMTLAEMIKATNKDPTLKGLRVAIRLNKWDSAVVKEYKHIKDELSISSHGLILRGTRIVVPHSLRQRAVDIAHEAHLGIQKTKALLREKVWFPQIDNVVKTTIEKCITCQAVASPNPPEPLAMTQMPKSQWEVLNIDFYGPRLFAVHGIPAIVRSDNGPPFHGEDYSRYLQALGVQVEWSTPKWPQGNALVERFMQPLGKALKTAKLDGRPWRQELQRFLLCYRTTPHSTTGVPPAELLFNRTIRGKLPVLKKRVVRRHGEAKEMDEKRQSYNNKRYSDKRRHAKKSSIRIGDSVLIRQEKRNKLTANFNSQPYTVTSRKKSEITATSKHGHTVTRNVSHCKLIPRTASESGSESDDSEDYSVPSKETNTDSARNENGGADEHQPPRRSERCRKRPDRYGHNILS